MQSKFPKITVDGVVLKDEKVLLVKRKNPPFKDKWALPGGFVDYGETAEDAVVREVLEETGLNTRVGSLFGVYSDPQRDPRGHTITVVYLLEVCGGFLKSGDDAVEVGFFALDDLPVLSFDHEKIIKDVVG